MEAERLNRDEKGKEGAGNDDGESGTTKRSFFALFGKNQPKTTVVFLFQTVLIFMVIATALVNLSINSPGENTILWVSLLSGSLGYSLPNPSIKNKNKVVVN